MIPYQVYKIEAQTIGEMYVEVLCKASTGIINVSEPEGQVGYLLCLALSYPLS
jgi:hypothetical protein